MNSMPDDNEIRENLIDAGCSREETESILSCIHFGDTKRAEKLIDTSRKRQLKQIHESQKCIDRLDYLSYQMKRERNRP